VDLHGLTCLARVQQCVHYRLDPHRLIISSKVPSCMNSLRLPTPLGMKCACAILNIPSCNGRLLMVCGLIRCELHYRRRLALQRGRSFRLKACRHGLWLQTWSGYRHVTEQGCRAIGGQAPVFATPQQQLMHQRLCVTWCCVSGPLQRLHACGGI